MSSLDGQIGPVYVVSGSVAQANRWARQHDIPELSLQHVTSPAVLEGIEPGVLFVVGNYNGIRHTLILDCARACGWNLDFGNADGSYSL